MVKKLLYSILTAMTVLAAPSNAYGSPESAVFSLCGTDVKATALDAFKNDLSSRLTQNGDISIKYPVLQELAEPLEEKKQDPVCGDMEKLLFISRKTGADLLITGEIKRSGETFMIYVKVFNAKNEETVLTVSEVFEGAFNEFRAKAAAAISKKIIYGMKNRPVLAIGERKIPNVPLILSCCAMSAATGASAYYHFEAKREYYEVYKKAEAGDDYDTLRKNVRRNEQLRDIMGGVAVAGGISTLAFFIKDGFFRTALTSAPEGVRITWRF